MRRNMICAALTALFLLMATDAKADIVEFDFETDDTANPAFAIAVDTGPDFSGTQDGITFTASATQDGAAANPNAGTSGLGIGNQFIDPGEVLTLTVTFDETAFEKVQLEEIDLGNIGGASDGAIVTLTDGTSFTFSDVATAPAGFAFTGGPPDEILLDDTAPAVINITSGQTFIFEPSSTGNFRLQRLSLHLTPVAVVAIPEPTSLALLGLLGGVVAIRRRR